MKQNNFIVFTAILIATSFLDEVKAQIKPLTLQSAIDATLQNNLQVKSSNLFLSQQKMLERTWFDIPKTEFTLQQDAAEGGSQGNSLGITQVFSLPIVYKKQLTILKEKSLLASQQKDLAIFNITRQVKLAYSQYQFNFMKIKLLKSLDSIYQKFKERAGLRKTAGETSNLEKYAAESKFYEVHLQLKQATIDLKSSEITLQKLLNTNDKLLLADTEYLKIPFKPINDTSLSHHPQMTIARQQVKLAFAELNAEKVKKLPDFTIGYFHQFLIKAFNPAKLERDYTPNTRIGGFQAGVSVPLFSKSQRAKIQAATINTSYVTTQDDAIGNELQKLYLLQYNEYLKQQEGLNHYEQIGLRQADEIIRISQLSYKLGEIGYIEYIQNLTIAFDTKLKYLETLNLYNQAIIELNYINGGL